MVMQVLVDHEPRGYLLKFLCQYDEEYHEKVAYLKVQAEAACASRGARLTWKSEE